MQARRAAPASACAGSGAGGSELDLSCIILTWNSAAYVQACIGSVLADLQSSGLRHEVLVIDNGSTDATLELLSALAGPALTVIALGHNTGTTFSRNIGLRMARGRFLAVLDSDIEIDQPGVFRQLIEHLQAHPAIGLVAPRLRFPSGHHQKTVDVFPTLLHKVRRLLRLRAMEAEEGRAGVGEQPTDRKSVV